MDLIIRNGWIVTAHDEFAGDVGIADGKIVSIGHVRDERARVLDAAGKLVLPGVIDMHTHIDHWGGSAKTDDDFFSGTRAAAFGGVTTVIDFAIQRPGETAEAALRRRRSEADGKVCIDYSLHAHVTGADEATLRGIPDIILDGAASFKMFTTYKKAGFKIEDHDCLTLMKRIHEHGGLVMIHAENDSMCESLTEMLVAADVAVPALYPDSRPDVAEAECIARMILFAEYTGATIYIVHVSTRKGAELIRRAQKSGLNVIAETCPHYLLLHRDRYLEADGYKYIMAPPLRDEEDSEALWESIRDGVLSVVSSDHCDYRLDKKMAGQRNFTQVSPGIHGTEWLLPLMYHYGVNAGRITRQQLVKLLSHHPAQIFGLSGKGNIAVGKDADLVILDPTARHTITDDNHHMQADFSPYRGFELRGYPETVISRGQVIVQNGQFLGAPGHGRFVRRSIRPEEIMAVRA
mgnify:CR=1 FL=1